MKIDLYTNYLLREGTLIKTNDWKDIQVGEVFCYVGTTPSTPPDVAYAALVKTDPPLDSLPFIKSSEYIEERYDLILTEEAITFFLNYATKKHNEDRKHIV